MAIMTKVAEPDNSEWHNSLKLGFANVQNNWSTFSGCKSFLESSSINSLD